MLEYSQILYALQTLLYSDNNIDYLRMCYHIIMKKYLTFLLTIISLLFMRVHCTAMVSPFDYSTIYAPAGMYRSRPIFT
jgi:hypothetical protein